MKNKITTPIQLGIFALIALLLAGVFLINAYIKKEKQRDLDDWAVRLGMVTENRSAAISNWLSAQTSTLEELSNNASLQLYLYQLSQRQQSPLATESAQLGFLRNLILASANRYGFSADSPDKNIPANLPRHSTRGLALLDKDKHLVAATAGMPQLGKIFSNTIDRAIQSGRSQISDIILDVNERALIGFAVPVPMVIGGKDTAQYSGVLFGVRAAQQDLYPLLSDGIPMTSKDEALLIKTEPNQLVFISPTQDASLPTRKTLPLDRSDLASVAAASAPGKFGQYQNYERRDVLSISRKIPSSDWVLVQQIDALEALQESNRHQQFLTTTFSLLLFFIAATLIAAWRHGSSVRALHDADTLRLQATALEQKTELLHAITSHVEAYVILLDEQQEILFANARLASVTATKSEELTGSTLISLLGPVNGQALSEPLRRVQTEHAIQHCIRQLIIGDEERVFECSLVPVDRVNDRSNTTLMVLHDITELQRIEHKHASLLRNLVNTLMHVVDLHDPNSAHHSAHVVEVSTAIGTALQLSEEDANALDMAASLANLGKIFVPKEILTSTAPLTDAEQALVRRHVQFGTELLKDLDFEGPVLDTISQKQELLDGSGYPKQLRGDEIILTARILAVANAFVALVSPRAYRSPATIQQALDQLVKDSNSHYDRRVVAALFHVTENNKDWSAWLEVD